MRQPSDFCVGCLNCDYPEELERENAELREKVAQLEALLDERHEDYRRERDRLNEENSAVLALLAAAQAVIERQREALELHGTHAPNCSMRKSHTEDCDCGLCEALALTPSLDALHEDREHVVVDFEPTHCLSVYEGDVPLYDAPAMPDGMVLVPREPTERMLCAAMKSNTMLMQGKGTARVFDPIYRAMIAAAQEEA